MSSIGMKASLEANLPEGYTDRDLIKFNEDLSKINKIINKYFEREDIAVGGISVNMEILLYPIVHV